MSKITLTAKKRTTCFTVLFANGSCDANLIVINITQTDILEADYIVNYFQSNTTVIFTKGKTITIIMINNILVSVCTYFAYTFLACVQKALSISAILISMLLSAISILLLLFCSLMHYCIHVYKKKRVRKYVTAANF